MRVKHHGPHFILSSSSFSFPSYLPSSSLSSSQQEKLETSESQQRPLKEHNAKLLQGINDLNSALRSQEKQMKQLAQENLVLVRVTPLHTFSVGMQGRIQRLKKGGTHRMGLVQPCGARSARNFFFANVLEGSGRRHAPLGNLDHMRVLLRPLETTITTQNV